jgi:adenylate kinase family enzyme
VRRIVVIGTSGSGKTTLAQQIAGRLELPHVELDALHWEPGWQQAPLGVFQGRVTAALSGDAWVVDGNYSKVRDLVWGRADTLIWLNYPLWVSLWRVFWRGVRRSVTREDLWNTGNRESLRQHLLTRDSMIWWVLKTHKRRRREYPVLFQQPKYAHLQVIQLRSPRETDAWLTNGLLQQAYQR